METRPNCQICSLGYISIQVGEYKSFIKFVLVSLSIDLISLSNKNRCFCMLPSIDPKIKRFYLEMGFTDKQIQRAHEYCQRNGADMLDALNMPAPSEAPPKQPQHPPK